MNANEATTPAPGYSVSMERRFQFGQPPPPPPPAASRENVSNFSNVFNQSTNISNNVHFAPQHSVVDPYGQVHTGDPNAGYNLANRREAPINRSSTLGVSFHNRLTRIG